MSVARVAGGALLGVLALPLACGERSGDPVIRLPAADEARAGNAGLAGAAGAPADPSGDGGAKSGGSQDPDPIGLCGECANSDACGDDNDACIVHQGERFCGRDCDDQHGCPDGYLCVELDNSQLWQCVPQSGCPAATGAVPELNDIRQYMLTRINAERAARAQAPLLPSSCLDELAQGSALAFARTDEPLGEFVKECDPIWPNCACDWNAEAELTIARYGLDWATAVERALDISREPNGRFTQAFLQLDMTDVGIGFWLSGDEAWIALSFR